MKYAAEYMNTINEEGQNNLLQIAMQKIRQYVADGGVGDLDLSHTPIASLPDGLQVGGDLDLFGAPIESLPQGLRVGGALDLRSSRISSLPDGLQVGGNLYLRYSKVESLPQGLKVGGDLHLSNTPAAKKYSKTDIRRMAPGVKGQIFTKERPFG